MAFLLEDLPRESEPEALFASAISALKAAGLSQVIDAAMLDDEDVEEVCCDKAVCEVIKLIRTRARAYKDGWARARSLDDRPAPVPATEPAPVPLASSRGASGSSAQLKRSVQAFTMRSAFGLGPSDRKRALPSSTVSVQAKKGADMDKALLKIHGVFARFAADAPRLREVSKGPPVMLTMQLQVYRAGSRSCVVVARRAKALENFFMDIVSFKWTVSKLSPFQVATWVRSRVAGGCKTAGVTSGNTLKLVHAATEWKMHTKHALVVGQVKSAQRVLNALEPPRPALTPSVDMVSRLEALVSSGSNAIIRCLAGFFCLLAFGSARASDAQGARGLHLTKDAIAGESILKNKHRWTPWFCNRRGLVGDWAADWLSALAGEGLPGVDFVLWAPNSAYGAWLDRPAEYADILRSLHFLLFTALGFNVQEAVEYNPHSFRHFLVESGQQLRALKACSSTDLEKLGHWEKGSSMPDSYDNAGGTSELSARYVVVNALQDGWRPSPQGELPLPLPSDNVGVIAVCHRASKKLHWTRAGMTSTLCKMWSCGTPNAPSKYALFDCGDESYKECPRCGLFCIGSKPR